jgi:hypothetical protein
MKDKVGDVAGSTVADGAAMDLLLAARALEEGAQGRRKPAKKIERLVGKAIELARRQGSRTGLAKALYFAATLSTEDRGEEFLREAVLISRETEGEGLLARCLYGLALRHGVDFDSEGQSLVKEALAIYRSVGDRKQEAECFSLLAMRDPDLPRAFAAAESADSILRALGEQYEARRVTLVAIVRCLDAIDKDQAERHAVQMLAEAKSDGDDLGQRLSLSLLVSIAAMRHDVESIIRCQHEHALVGRSDGASVAQTRRLRAGLRAVIHVARMNGDASTVDRIEAELKAWRKGPSL